jgi:hypothetical protein
VGGVETKPICLAAAFDINIIGQSQCRVSGRGGGVEAEITYLETTHALVIQSSGVDGRMGGIETEPTVLATSVGRFRSYVEVDRRVGGIETEPIVLATSVGRFRSYVEVDSRMGGIETEPSYFLSALPLEVYELLRILVRSCRVRVQTAFDIVRIHLENFVWEIGSVTVWVLT